MENSVVEPLVYFTAEFLLSRGGKFYEIASASWCDCGVDSYYLVPGKGYTKYVEG